MGNNRFKGLKVRKQSAICPYCEKVHKIYIYWTGNGRPRHYCPACRELLKDAELLDGYVDFAYPLRLEENFESAAQV